MVDGNGSSETPPTNKDITFSASKRIKPNQEPNAVLGNEVENSDKISDSKPEDFGDGKAFKQKNPERLQAQAEMFADKGVKNFSEDQAMLLKYSSELAKVRDLNNLPPDLPQELVDLIQTHKDAYVSFLRRESKLETTFIEDNANNYKEKFHPIVEELKKKMSGGNAKSLSLLPEYLGSGSNGTAFRIEVDGKTYAAKFGSTTQANFEIKALLRAKGIPHATQLVSYSFEDGVVIMELLPGRDVTGLTIKDAPQYPDEHIIQLIETVKELDQKGIMIDPKPSNFLYDPQEGFSILDFHLKNGGDYDLPQEIIDLRLALSARKQELLDYNAPDYQEKADVQRTEQQAIYLPTMARFLGILQDKYPDILSAWKKRHEKDKANPRMAVSELIDRTDIPSRPDFETYLQELEAMGF